MTANKGVRLFSRNRGNFTAHRRRCVAQLRLAAQFVATRIFFQGWTEKLSSPNATQCHASLIVRGYSSERKA